MIFNRTSQTSQRRSLRKTMTEPERRLWAKIRARQLGVKFRRQHGIGCYIVDFYCLEWRLVIELDGDTHETLSARKYDFQRDSYMQSLGLTVLRFSNRDVMQDIDGVLGKIVCGR